MFKQHTNTFSPTFYSSPTFSASKQSNYLIKPLFDLTKLLSMH